MSSRDISYHALNPPPPQPNFMFIDKYHYRIFLILLFLAFHGRPALHRNVSRAMVKVSPYSIAALYHDFAVVI